MYITVEMAAIIAKIETIVLIYSITLSKDIESYPFLHDVLGFFELFTLLATVYFHFNN